MGTGVYAARLLASLSGRPGVHIEVFNGWPDKSCPRTTLGRGLRTVRSLLWTHAWLPIRLRSGHFDLLHSPAFISPVASPCPVVLTIHDIAYQLYPEYFARRFVAYLKTILPATVRSAAAIICGSEYVKAEIVRAYAISADKVHVIQYGVDHQRFHPRAVLDLAWASKLGIRKGYLLHVGALARRKDIPTLLRAVANLRSRGKWERQLVLAGSEALGMVGAAEIHETIRQLDLSGIVLLPGRIPDEHLPGLYAHASLLVMPSLYEGFGFPVLESMATGTPVVATNAASLPEVAGNAAVLVPPKDELALADAINDVIDNRAFAEKLRSDGLARASRFSWERTAAETIEVYRSVLG